MKSWKLYLKEYDMYSAMLLYNDNLKKDISFIIKKNECINLLDDKGDVFIKAHYPTLAVAKGAFIQYALNFFYNEQRYYKKNLKRLFHTLSGVEKEYRKEYKKRSAT